MMQMHVVEHRRENRVCPAAEDELAWRELSDQVEVVRAGSCSHGRGSMQRHKECWESS